MIYYLAYFAYYVSLLFALVCCLYRYKVLDAASKVLAILVCCAFVNEGAAFYLEKKYHNNLPLYAIYCLIEFFILCLYFNKIIDVFIRRNFGIYIGIFGIVLGALNIIFVQHMNNLNSYFLLFEGLSVIGMSLFAFFRLLLKYDTFYLYKYPHFWFISILIFFWSITFITWGLYDYINLKLGHRAWKINFGILTVGVITYVSFGCVFLMYPKLRSINE